MRLTAGKKTSFLERPVAASCVCAALLCTSLIIIIERARLATEDRESILFMVSQKHYGLDAREMERSVTIPLEDALYALPGVKEVSSVSNNSESRVSVIFERAGALTSGKAAGRYEAVSDAAQRVYETLPSSAQRPEILREDDSRAPVWTAAVSKKEAHKPEGNVRPMDSVRTTDAVRPADAAYIPDLAVFLERTVKSALSAIEGVSEVQIAGTGLPEIHILLDDKKCAALGIGANEVASALAQNDALFPAGSLDYNGISINVRADGRYSGIPELEEAFIPLPKGGTVRLFSIARVLQKEREPDIISRLNGEKTAIISASASGGAGLGRLSKELAKKVSAWEASGFEFDVLVDRGKESQAAFNSVLGAAAGGALTVALLAFLLRSGAAGGGAAALVSALAVPFICVLSLAVLSAAGSPLDKTILAGISAGLGVAVDTVILTGEHLSLSIVGLRKKEGKAASLAAYASGAGASLKKLFPPLAAGSATTIAALLPLAIMENAPESVKVIAVSIGIITAVSFAASLALMPPLFLGAAGGGKSCAFFNFLNKPIRIKTIFIGKCSRFINRRFAEVLCFSVRHPAAITLAAAVFTVAAFAVLSAVGFDVSSGEAEDSVYAQVEFDGGLLKSEVDAKLAQYALLLKQDAALKTVETSAKTGQGNVFVTFDKKKTKTSAVRALLRESEIPGGFVYINEASDKERRWTITVSGDEGERCREIASFLAEQCAALPIVDETVLNFKKGPPRLVIRPNRERLKEAGLSFASLGSAERNAVHAPVAYKRLDSAKDNAGGSASQDITGRGETDVRLRVGLTEEPSKKDVRSLTLANSTQGSMANAAAPVPLASYVTFTEEEDVSGIMREGRRRTASITIRTRPLSAKKVRAAVMPFLTNSIDLEENYALVFDRAAIEAEEALSRSVFYFILALFFCYIVIAMANESFTLPLIVLAAVPPSMAVPAFVLPLFGFALNSAAVCAFVAVSGIAVNASVLTVDALRGIKIYKKPSNLFFAIFRAVRSRRSALFSTSATTIASALPFVFLSESANEAVRTLALVSALGVAGSCLASLTLIPALTVLRKRK